MGSACSSKAGADASSKKQQSQLVQVLWEHKEGINCMAVSEDGTVLASGSDDATIRLWSAKTTPVECIGILRGHEDYITALQIVENYIITASADRSVRKWDLSTCDCLLWLQGHKGTVNRIIATPEFIFSSSYDRTVRCHDFETGEVIRVFQGHEKSVFPMIFLPNFIPPIEDEEIAQESVAFSLEGNRDLLFTGSADQTSRIYSFSSGKTVHTLRGHDGGITCMTLDLETKVLLTGSVDHTIRSWNIVKGSPLKVFEGHDGTIITMLVANKVLFSASSDFTVRSWVIQFAECARVFKGHKHTVSCMKHFNGLIFTGSGDGHCRAFVAKSGLLVKTFKDKLLQESRQARDIENNGGKKPKKKKKQKGIVKQENAVYAIQPVEGRVFTGSHDGMICAWEADQMQDDTEMAIDFGDEKKKKKKKKKRSDSDSDYDSDEEED